MTKLNRRSMLLGLSAGAAVCAPSILRAQAFTNHICYAEAFGMVGDYITPGVGSYSGSVNASFTDNTGPWNLIMATVAPGDTVILPPGFCGFKSQPAIIPDFVKVVGAGGESSLVKSFSGTNEQIFIRGGSYTIVENVLLWQANGYTDGVAIGRVGSSPTDTPYKMTLRNVMGTYFSTGMWYGGCKISGEFGSPNYGTRLHTIDDCTFKSSFYGVQLTACNAAKITSITVPQSTWGVWFVGVANNPCTDGYVDGLLESTILCYNTRTTLCNVSVLNRAYFDSNCAGNTINAAFQATAPSMAGSNNHVFANGLRWDI